jgi:hypothetical protein
MDVVLTILGLEGLKASLSVSWQGCFCLFEQI